MRFSTFLPRLWANWITLLGSTIATISGFGGIVLVVVGLAAPHANPYGSLVVLIGVPLSLGLGLVLIPIGLAVDRRRGKQVPPDTLQAAFAAAFADRSGRMRIIFVAVVTLANVGIFAFVGQQAVHRMDSPQFCGTACHVPMQPEWEAWNRSPHSNVACVECHIGPGAAGLIKAKLNGIHQLLGVVTGNYNRPVTVGLDKQLPVARDTCENCHSPQRWKANFIKIFAHYEQDQANTPKYNAMLMRVGGYNRLTKKYQGIHAHADPDKLVKFEYFDPQRSKIGKVTVVENGQVTAEYVPAGPAQTPIGVRTMDCMDCHNRPTHQFDGTPRNAVDRALFLGALDPKMPFIAQVAAGLLSQPAFPRDQSEAHFKTAIAAEYQSKHPEVKPDAAALDRAAATLSMIYLRNIFPDMNVSWNQYRSNLGHKVEGVENAGCFRCHDNQHTATLADGKKKKLGQDCDSCHGGLVFDEDPAKFDDTMAAMLPAAD